MWPSIGFGLTNHVEQEQMKKEKYIFESSTDNIIEVICWLTTIT